MKRKLALAGQVRCQNEKGYTQWEIVDELGMFMQNKQRKGVNALRNDICLVIIPLQGCCRPG